MEIDCVIGQDQTLNGLRNGPGGPLSKTAADRQNRDRRRERNGRLNPTAIGGKRRAIFAGSPLQAVFGDLYNQKSPA